jgi:riboflavin kinase/FMN adenylyltransferase
VSTVQLIRGLGELPAACQRGALSIGNFDGVHRGHARLVEQLVRRAEVVGGPAVVFTFDPHPAQLLYPEAVPPALTPTARKAELLGELGVDVVIAYPTNRDVLALSPDQFFQRIVVELLRTQALVEGPNFFFGSGRSGSIRDLLRLCEQAGMVLDVVPPLQVGERYVSSSWIRELILAGDVRAADTLLTRPYRVEGEVVRGAGRGTRIGFPTANVEPHGLVLPPFGVYAGCAYVDGQRYAAAAHLGPNPTFSEEFVKLEVHLIDCEQRPLYDKHLAYDFLDRLRDVRPFDGVDALRSQLRRDVEAVRQIVNQ